MTKTLPRSRRLALRDMDPKTIVRVYSVQHEAAWQRAQERGYWTGERDFVESEEEIAEYGSYWLPKYDWMREQMAKRIPGYSGDYPIWAWFKRPNMRRYRYSVEPMVMLVADVPRERMLISDYDWWHLPLNVGACCYTEAEDDAMDAAIDAYYLSVQGNTQRSHQRYPDFMTKTWERIFDLDDRLTTPERREWIGHEAERLQACVDRIHLDEIVSVKPTKGRLGSNGGRGW